MKRLLLIICLVAVPTVAWTQDAAPAVVAADASAGVDTNKDGKVDAAETKALVDADASIGDTVKDVAGVVSAAQDIKGKSGTALALAIAALLAGIFKVLLSVMKLLSKNTGWFNSSRGKAALKYSTLGLGALAAAGAGVAMALGADLAWWDVVIIGASGPGSMVVHELVSLAPALGKHAAPADTAAPDTGPNA